MPKLSTHRSKEYVARDRAALERLDRRRRAQQGVDERVRIAVALYDAAKATRPGWPTDADRMRDVEHHIRLRELLDRAGDVGAR